MEIRDSINIAHPVCYDVKSRMKTSIKSIGVLLPYSIKVSGQRREDDVVATCGCIVAYKDLIELL